MWVIITAVATFLSCDKALFFLTLSSGREALLGIGPSCEGFRFLGVTLLILGVVILINALLCLLSAPEMEMIPRTFWNVVVTALAIFAFVVSSNGGGESVPGRSYKVYRLQSYSKWMQNKVNHAHNWQTYYKKAIVQARVCSKFSKEFEFDTLDAIHTQQLTPFQSSCCMPPENCSFNYTSPTVWVKPENGTYTDDDCNSWNNDPNILCYDCQTCKAAFVQDVSTQYFLSGMVLLTPPIKALFACLCCTCLGAVGCTMIGVGAIIYAGLGAIFNGLGTIFDDLRRRFGRGLASSGDNYIPIEGA